jgi:hypothetical protein
MKSPSSLCNGSKENLEDRINYFRQPTSKSIKVLKHQNIQIQRTDFDIKNDFSDTLQSIYLTHYLRQNLC